MKRLRSTSFALLIPALSLNLLSVSLPAEAKARKARRAKAANEGPAVKMNKIATCKITPQIANASPPPAPADVTGDLSGDLSGEPAPEKAKASVRPNNQKMVLVIKQWHLAPTTVTKGFKEKYPQEQNQTAIYKNLSDAVKKKKVDLVIGEGCEGEITSDFPLAFNGWKIDELKAQAQTKAFPKIIAHVPMKLEARWGAELTTMCGDNEKLIQEGNMRMSNLRGWMGFWGRLSEAKPEEDDKLKLYAEAAADLLQVPKTTPVAELKNKIRARALEELDLFKKSLYDRDEYFVKVAQERDFKTAAIVIGGLHAEDLQAKLEKAGLPCEVYEPPGYSKQDESLIKDFQTSLK